MRKTFFRYRFFFIPFAIAGFLTLFSFIVMQLWNNVLTEVVNVHTVSFWQAMGILVLSKILFGGFGPGRRGGPPAFARRRMEERLKHMSPEDREKFKAQMQNRFCGGDWSRSNKDIVEENTANQPM
jgi:hypothetical protein